MKELLCILGFIVFVYGSAVFWVMYICKCSLEEARDKIASFFQRDVYRLDCDYNFRTEINKICLDILGEKRYQELCKLEEYSSTFVFVQSSGYPSFKITMNVNDENEKKC